MPKEQELNLNIVQDVDWDPMEILMNNKGKVNDENFKAPDIADDEEENEEEQEDSTKKPAKKVAKSGKPDFTTLELSDEEIQAGLIATSEKEKTGKAAHKQANAGKPAATPAAKTDDDEEDENDNKTTGKIDDPNNAFAVHYNLMVEAGEWQEIEGFDGTHESYIKARDYNSDLQREAGVDEYLEEAFEKNPEGKQMGKRLLAHLARGGRVSDFQTLYAPLELNFAAIEGDDDAQAQEAALEMLPRYYTSIGWKKPQIDQKMALLKKMDSVVEEARLIAPSYKEAIETKATNYATQLETQNKTNKATIQKTNTTLLTMIEKGHTFGTIQIGKDKKSKQEYQNYLFGTAEGADQPNFAAELQAGMKDPEFILYLAASLKHKLYKNTDPLLDKTKSKQEATSSIERTLSAALLNKKLGSQQSQHSPSSSTNKGGSSSYEFNLDEAIPIRI